MTKPDESMDEYWRRRINDVDKNPQSDDPLRSPEAFSAFKRQWHEWKRQNVPNAHLESDDPLRSPEAFSAFKRRWHDWKGQNVPNAHWEKNKSIQEAQPASPIKTSLVDKLMDGPLGGLSRAHGHSPFYLSGGLSIYCIACVSGPFGYLLES